MRRYIDKHNNFGRIWMAQTAHFTISLILEESFQAYDGDDESGEIAEKLNNGDFVMFDSKVVVEINIDGANNITIGADYLGNSVYEDGKTLQFIHDGYFQDMLNLACSQARDFLANAPKLRTAA